MWLTGEKRDPPGWLLPLLFAVQVRLKLPRGVAMPMDLIGLLATLGLVVRKGRMVRRRPSSSGSQPQPLHATFLIQVSVQTR